MFFKPRKDTVSRRIIRSVQMAVLLAAGIIAGGTLAYLIGSGTGAGAGTEAGAGTDYKDPARAFVEEDARAAYEARIQAMPAPLAQTGVLKVARADSQAVYGPITEARKALPQIAIIIDDIGLNRRAFDQLMLMEGPLTFSILPYAPEAQTYADLARRAGHDVMLHLPMAPAGLDRADAAGPDTLRIADTPRELRRKLAINLAAFEGYGGVNNHMGSGLTTNAPHMTSVLRELNRREVFFIDSVTTGETLVAEAARVTDTAYYRRDVFLDSDYEEVTKETVLVQLDELARIARAKGHAIGIGHPYGSTIEALTQWLAENDGEIELIMASSLVESLAPAEEKAPVIARLR